MASQSAALCAHKTLQFFPNGILKLGVKHFQKFLCGFTDTAGLFFIWLDSLNFRVDKKPVSCWLKNGGFPSPSSLLPSLPSLPPTTRHRNMYYYLSGFIHLLCVHVREQTHACVTQWIETPEDNLTRSVLCSIMWVLGLQLKFSVSLASTLPHWVISEVWWLSF